MSNFDIMKNEKPSNEIIFNNFTCVKDCSNNEVQITKVVPTLVIDKNYSNKKVVTGTVMQLILVTIHVRFHIANLDYSLSPLTDIQKN